MRRLPRRMVVPLLLLGMAAILVAHGQTFLLLLGVIAATMIALLIDHRIMHPVRQLTDAAWKLSRGERVRLPDIHGAADVREMFQAFNTMQNTLVRLLENRTLLLASIGHDLRTPLASLRIRAELVNDAELRQAMIRTLDEMGVMVEEILNFSKDDVLSEPTQTVAVNEFVQHVVNEQRAQGLDIQFASHLNGDVTYRYRPVTLKRALDNLIENSARYGAVSVQVSSTSAALRIEILDCGPGIEPEALERVFEPFVQLGAAPDEVMTGTGLGLTAARACVHAHGGEIFLENREQGGVRAVVELPA